MQPFRVLPPRLGGEMGLAGVTFTYLRLLCTNCASRLNPGPGSMARRVTSSYVLAPSAGKYACGVSARRKRSLCVPVRRLSRKCTLPTSAGPRWTRTTRGTLDPADAAYKAHRSRAPDANNTRSSIFLERVCRFHAHALETRRLVRSRLNPETACNSQYSRCTWPSLGYSRVQPLDSRLDSR